MAHAVLSRFETTLLDNSSPPVYAAGVNVSFYRQGATVSSGGGMAAGAYGPVIVYDTGEIMPGDTVLDGFNGAPLVCLSVDSSTQLTLANYSGKVVTLAIGGRLLLASRRPNVFKDPWGTISLGSQVTADSNGRVSVYIELARFDYVVSSSVAIDCSSRGVLNGGDTLSWPHPAGGKMVLVGLIWDSPTGLESIVSVTYGGVAMSFVAVSGSTNLYKLANPPPGEQVVTVSFTAGGGVHAVGGAISASSLHASTPLGTVQTASGTGTSASISVGVAGATSALFHTLGVRDATDPAVAVTANQVNQHWGETGGSAPAIVTGGGAVRTGLSGTVLVTWAITASHPWSLLAIELKPSTTLPNFTRLFVDASGTLVPTPDWLNVRDFISIQAAIDALPANGGVVYLPAGEYPVNATIVIPPGKAVHLIGDGANRTTIFSEDKDVNILWIQSSYSTVENLTIRGVQALPTNELLGRGIVVGQLGETAEVMRRISILGCRIVDTASWCLYFLDDDDGGAVEGKTLTIWAHIERCEFRSNYVAGVLRLGKGCFQHLYLNCGWEFFRGFAVSANVAGGVTFQTCTFEDRRNVRGLEPDPPPPDELPYVEFNGCFNIRVLCCWFESHALDPDNANDVLWRFINVGPYDPCEDVTIDSCRFVRQAGHFPRLLKVKNDSKAIALINATCILAEVFDSGRFTSTDPMHLDIFVEPGTDGAIGSELFLSGGIVHAKPGTINSPALFLPSVKGLSIAASGPRLTPPSIDSDDRDDPDSLGRDAKEGDLIFNTETVRPEVRVRSSWQQIPSRAASVAFDDDSSMSAPGSLVANGIAGMYRMSVYLEKLTGGAGTVQIDVVWTDDTAQRSRSVSVSDSGANAYTSDVFSIYVAASQSITYQVFTPQGHQVRARIQVEVC